MLTKSTRYPDFFHQQYLHWKTILVNSSKSILAQKRTPKKTPTNLVPKQKKTLIRKFRAVFSFSEGSWSGDVGLKLPKKIFLDVPGIGYNPFANHLLTSWDIIVGLFQWGEYSRMAFFPQLPTRYLLICIQDSRVISCFSIQKKRKRNVRVLKLGSHSMTQTQAMHCYKENSSKSPYI